MSSDVAPARGFEPSRFLGTWSIVLSSYPYWRPRFGHRRVDPDVTYARLPSERPGEERWLDEVRYHASPWLSPRGALRDRAIVGTDVMQPGAPGHFLWKGDGALAIMRNHWFVVAFDPSYQWAVTYFPRSAMGSPAGVDVYVRHLDVDADLAGIVRDVCRTGELRDAAQGMFAVARSGPTRRYGDVALSPPVSSR